MDPFINRGFRELVKVADECGYTDGWSFEANSCDAFSPIAAMAMLSDKLRFGTAIIPVYTRSAALIAMTAATVQNLSGGRSCSARHLVAHHRAAVDERAVREDPYAHPGNGCRRARHHEGREVLR